MSAGRPPKPTALRRAMGNPGHRPLPENEPEPPDNPVVKPSWVKGRAGRIWKEYAPLLIEMGTLTVVDVPQFAAWCDLYAELQALGARLFPASKLTRMEALASKFGMDPSSRARMGTTGKKSGDKDPAEDYFGGPKLRAG